MKKMKHIRLFESHKLFEAAKDMPKELLEKIKAELKKTEDNPKTVYWDRNDSLSDKQIDQIIDGNLDKFYEEMSDVTLDTNTDLEIEAIVEALEAHQAEVEAWMGEEIDDMKDLAMELRDEYSLYDYITIDEDWDQLFRNTGDVNCRVTMWSNYEGLQSDYQETQGQGYDYADEYFMHIVDLLNLNPLKVQKALDEQGLNNAGDFPDMKDRDGNEFVKYDEFATELANNTTLSQLTFVGKVDLSDVFKKAKDEENPLAKFVIPKGNNCGLFGSSQGGGSVMEMELLKDFPIDTTKPYFEGGTQYDQFSILYDKENSYSIDSVYGVTQSFWGGDIKF